MTQWLSPCFAALAASSFEPACAVIPREEVAKVAVTIDS
jgi:hypothetical protein